MGGIDVSVIVPMLNESAHVEQLVGDLAAQDYNGTMEVIVAGGGSTDGSAEKIKAAAEASGRDLLLIDNPAGWVSTGLNACTGRPGGDPVTRLGLPLRYPPA